MSNNKNKSPKVQRLKAEIYCLPHVKRLTLSRRHGSINHGQNW